MLVVLSILLSVFAVSLFLVPRQVAYDETISIQAPVEKVFDYLRMQSHLMRWSAWPSTTNSTCECEGPSGEVGERTVFYSKGKRFGHQEVTALDPLKQVTLKLFSKGPPQQPVLRFDLTANGTNETMVKLHFTNEIALPFNVLLRIFGVVRWTRNMHRKDLAGLKRYAEPPHLTYTGEPAF
jgi:uncharacterized protein YndB with AHSA1/START domain